MPANQPVVARMEYDKLLAACLQEKGDAKAGARLFVKQGCINCHTITKGETLKGPYLGDIGTRYKRPELIESIVKPSAKIAQGFEAQWFQTSAGKVHDGFIVRESGDEIELRTATGVRGRSFRRSHHVRHTRNAVRPLQGAGTQTLVHPAHDGLTAVCSRWLPVQS